MKKQIYELLESSMLDYKDYVDVPVIEQEGGEKMVLVPTTRNLTYKQYREEMKPYTGDDVYVRRRVAVRLALAASLLQNFNDEMSLEVAYGYRALELQNRYFEEEKAKLEDKYSGDELLSATHKLIAVPNVAGHPAGAAVDVQLKKNGEPLDFGTAIWEFVPDSYTASPFISNEAKRNRSILRSVMVAAGFAPFDGEWWHFSYGDKEWAKYYDESFALYEQIAGFDLDTGEVIFPDINL